MVTLKSPEDQKFVRQLEQMGCSATAIAGSVSNVDLIRDLDASSKQPIAGVIQMSMALQVSKASV